MGISATVSVFKSQGTSKLNTVIHVAVPAMKKANPNTISVQLLKVPIRSKPMVRIMASSPESCRITNIRPGSGCRTIQNTMVWNGRPGVAEQTDEIIGRGEVWYERPDSPSMSLIPTTT